jgi:hypothetical protein
VMDGGFWQRERNAVTLLQEDWLVAREVWARVGLGRGGRAHLWARKGYYSLYYEGNSVKIWIWVRSGWRPLPSPSASPSARRSPRWGSISMTTSPSAGWKDLSS